MSQYTVSLVDAEPQVARIGGKAASLVELRRAGFDVPAAVCITVDAYREWAGKGELTPALVAALLQAFRSLQAPVAVRSSSPAEDLPDASYAGQYTTMLGIHSETALLTAVESCFRSASSAAAVAYRRTKGQDDDASMAVLIQELVPADVAGVMFTMNPVSDRADQIVVNANFGLGESVVSGHAEPDTFMLDKVSGRITERRLGTKSVVTRPAEDGVREWSLDAARQHDFCLTDAQLATLHAAAVRLEAHYDCPIDAEWAFCGDRLHLLQARPVTTGFAAYHAWLLDAWAHDRGLTDNPETIWVRGSVLSGLRLSPLYYSEMSPFFADMFVRIAKLHGAPPIRRKIFCYYDGFAYTDAEFSSMADPPGDIRRESPFGSAWRANLRIALRYPFSLAFWCNIRYYERMWRQVWWPEIERSRPDLRTASAEQIRCFIEIVERQRRERSVVAGLAVGYAPHFIGLLAWLLDRWWRDQPPETLGILTSGLPDSLTHAENAELWDLTRMAGQSPSVLAAIRQGRFDQIAAIEGGPECIAAIDAFRRRHAHRGCSDRDIYQPRWGDDRDLVLQQIRLLTSLGEDADPRSAHARTVARRTTVEEQLLGSLNGPLKALRRAIFRRVAQATRRYVIHRDNQRHTFEPYFMELRGAYRALGERFVADGSLQARDDIFFLAKSEIYAHIDGLLNPRQLSARALWRRTWWERVTTAEPPEYLKGRRPHDPGQSTTDGIAAVRGSPGAPGIVTGPARVIASLQELERLRSGDIIVTYAIDPAWTPVFATIGGVISVEGGMLAHAAVLGREYGLPVVLGARNAMQAIKEGDVVRIDGTAGTITVLSTTPAAA